MKITKITKFPVINISLDTIKNKKQALIFVNSKNRAEKTAEDISKKTNKKLQELSDEILNVLPKPTKQCIRLSKCIKKGIAFHHSGLHRKQKNLIEQAFKDRKLSIICCTPTLAAGVDLPAFRTILLDLKRYSRWGMQYIPTLEYMQMAGRAGRPGQEDWGEAITIATTEPQKTEIIERFLHGEPEQIFSKLAVEPVLRTYLLSLISTNFVNTKKQILDFFEKTFWAHQFKDMSKLTEIIDRMLQLLVDYEFIECEKPDFITANESYEEKYISTKLGKRISELYLDPYTANKLIKGLKQKKETKPFSYLQLISNTIEMFPPMRTSKKDHELISEKLIENSEYLLQKEPSFYDINYDDFLNSIKTALFFEDWINEKSEDYIFDEYKLGPGGINAKVEIADWLIYCMIEMDRVLNLNKYKELTKLRTRVKQGVKEELIPLLKFKGIGRFKARKLFDNKLKDIKDLKNIDITTLAQIIGPKTSMNIKIQLGEEIKEIPKTKRKGQTSLLHY